MDENKLYQTRPHLALVGGKHRETNEIIFPKPEYDPAEDYAPFPLSTQGLLWSYTVQRFPPKRPYIGVTDPLKFVPYAVGYIELPAEIIIESRIVTEDVNTLKIGMPMRLVIEQILRHDGEHIPAYAFQPLTGDLS